MQSGRPVTMDTASPARRIWQPPSQVDPSRLLSVDVVFFTCLGFDAANDFFQQGPIRFERVTCALHLSAYGLKRLLVLQRIAMSKAITDHCSGLVVIPGHRSIALVFHGLGIFDPTDDVRGCAKFKFRGDAVAGVIPEIESRLPY